MRRERQIADFITQIETGQIEGATTEAERIARVRSMGAVPEDTCPMIPESVARGPVRRFEMKAAYPDGEDKFVFKPAGYRGRKTLQLADTFDIMAARSSGRGRGSPFTPSQIAMGRAYRDLVEAHESAGVRCSSVEVTTRGGDGRSFMDAVLIYRGRIDALRRRMDDDGQRPQRGPALVLSVRRMRPSQRGGRISVTARRAVDMICIEDASIADVLREHGWSVKGPTVRTLARGVGAALDRMIGPEGRRGIHTWRSADPISI
jgi:hypothetical protein